MGGKLMVHGFNENLAFGGKPIKILIETSPNMLCRFTGEKTPAERDFLRAKQVRKMIP